MAGTCKKCGGLTTNTRAKTPLGLCFSCEFPTEKEDSTIIDDRILVPREDYETLQSTVQQLQTKYAAILDDKQRWRNFAILSAATQLVAQNKCYSDEGAIKRANEILTAIEEGKFVKTGTSQGTDPGR